MLLISYGLILVASSAFGQLPPSVSCSVSTDVPRILRAEGATELAGDLIITCTGGQPTPSGTALPIVNFTLFFNTTVTSRLLSSNNSEALALIDEPPPVSQLACGPAGACGTLTGTGTGLGVYSGINGQGNIFQGSQASTSSIVWQIPFDPPGVGGSRILRFTNLRVNASSLGVSSTLVPTSVMAFVEVDSQSINLSNPTVTLGFVQPGLVFSVRSPDDTLPQTSPAAVPACSNSLTQVAVLRYTENFPTVFRTRTAATFISLDVAPDPVDQDEPGFPYSTESGFYNHTLGGDSTTGPLGNAGLADSGTRLIAAVFENIPAGVALYVDVHNIHAGPSSAARLVANEAGTFSAVVPAPQSTFAQIPVSNFSATAVWEVLGSDNTQIDTLDFGVYMGFSGPAFASSAPVTVQGNLAPLYGSATSYTFVGPSLFPSFIDTSTAIPLLTFVKAPDTCPLLAALPNPVTLNGSTPVTVEIVSSGQAALTASAVPTTASGGDWLLVTPASGPVPGLLTISATGVPANSGVLNGTVVVSALGASNTVSIPVSFIPPLVMATPSSLSFTAEAGEMTPLGQQVVATTQLPGETVGATVADGTPWLTVSPSTATNPANFLVVVNPQGLATGTYNGVVTFAGTQTGAVPLMVTLTVTPAEALITPRRATFSYSRADPVPPPNQTFSITSSTGAQTAFKISTRVITPPGGTWLAAIASGVVTPANVTVSVNPAGLGQGSFVGVVTVTPSSDPEADSATPPQQNIIVTVGDIAPGPYMAAPEPLVFDAASLSQMVTVNNSAPTNTSATPVTGVGGWLAVSPMTFVTPPLQTLVATANGSQLAPNMYTGVLAIDDSAGTTANAAFLDATLTVGDAAGIVMSLGQDSVTTTLTSDAAPAKVTIPIMGNGPAIPVTAMVTDGSSWLSASGGVTVPSPGVTAPPGAASPAPITITIDPSSLTPGSYDDSVQVSSPEAINKASVAVHLQVTSPPNADSPQITEIVNGASFAKGQPVTPGSLITLRGVNLATGTAQLHASTIPLPDMLGTTSVTFNGFPAPLLYVAGAQINAQLPWNVLAYGSTSGTVDAVVTSGGRTSAPFQVFVSPYSPGIFIDFATNRAIAQNVDGSLVAPPGAYSSPSHPASVGSVISIYCTGLGAVDVPVNNGVGAGTAPTRKTLTFPTVLIGGIVVQPTFSGLQPQFVGINQVNVMVPAGVPTGDVSLQLQVGGITTTPLVKLTVGN